MAKRGVQSRIGANVLGLIFAGIGGGFLVFGIVPSLLEWQAMQSWHAVEARLTAAELIVNSGSDSTTYRATAQYRYSVNGQTYVGSRVAINSGSDNIGHFQRDLGSRLEAALQRDEPVRAWIDPNDPGEAVLNRELRWSLLGFKLIFVVVFGGIGVAVLFLRDRRRDTDTAFDDKPWLSLPEWQSGEIRSTAGKTFWVLWIFAVVWNLISLPLAFAIPAELEKGNQAALIGLLFPVAGAGLLIGAIVSTRRWLRFGPTPLKMDPFPGRLGETAGGHIDIKLPYDPSARFDVSLACTHSYISGSGKHRNRKEKTLWQDSKQLSPRSGSLGTRLDIEFAVPSDLPSSEPPSDNYHKWILSVAANLKGPNYSRQFEIPVFPGDSHTAVAHDDGGLSEPETRQDSGRRIDTAAVESKLNIQRRHDGIEWHYLAGRNKGLGIGLIVFGTICGAAAVFIYESAVPGIVSENRAGLVFEIVFNSAGVLMTAVFGAFALGMLLGGIYAMSNSLSLRLANDRLRSVRRLFGITVRDMTVPVVDIHDIDKKITSRSSSGTKTRVSYTVHARIGRKKIALAENLESASEADTAAEYFRERFGML